MTAAELRTLAAEATPGEWEMHRTDRWRVRNLIDGRHGGYITDGIIKENARLIALSPDLALLAADLADYLVHNTSCYGWDYDRRRPKFHRERCSSEKPCDRCALLARFAQLA